MAELHISELLDDKQLGDALEGGFVRIQTHPTEPLQIFNYTEKTQYEQAWGPVTMLCRGLIVDDKGQVKARPFGKFFNFGDPMAGELDASAKTVVVDKMDGSLGILYPSSTGWAIATRGSFASDQALHATEVLRWRYPDFSPPEGITVLWEIIYPENRIVCDYGGADDLFVLGGVEISTGRVLSPDEVPGWPGPSAAVFTVPTLADALAMPPRPGAEGIVVRMVDTGQMVKLKQEAYVRAHAVVTRTSTRTIWQALATGEGLKFIEDFIPDEFFAWADQVSTDLQSAKDAWVAAARAEFERMPKDVDRKTFAETALKSPYRAALFRLLDERGIDDMAWKAVQPAYERPYQSIQEEVA